MLKRLAFVIVVLAAIVPAIGATAPGGLVASLQVDRATFNAAQPIRVTLTLTNTGADPMAILRWLTPVDEIEHPILDVELNGQEVTYTGRLWKRAMPGPEDFLALGAGETLTIGFDPSAAYDMSRDGLYGLRYRAEFRGVSVESNEVWLQLEGTVAAPPRPWADAYALAAKYTNCSTSQQTTLKTAEPNATTLSSKALSYLQTNPSDSRSLYKTWFDYSGKKYAWSTVTAHYSSIYNAFAAGSATFNCGCTSNAYAYVYPASPYMIYLCRVYWTAPPLGTDSQAGTLVHEMSHFYVTASTKDWVYGTAGAMNLAKTNPKKATTNADNHEYFAENQ